MAQTKREWALTQIALQEKIQQAGVNIVTCGNCGSVLLHETPAESIQCPHCGLNSDPCDFPDLWYTGIELSAEFDEPTEPEYYHVLEHGMYGEVGHQGCYDLFTEANARKAKLEELFPDLSFSIYPSNSDEEPEIVTV